MPKVEATALAEVLERISDAFLAFDADWRFTYVNRAAAEFIGRPAEELVGKVLWEEYPQVLGTRAEAEYRTAAATLEPREFEMVGPALGRPVEVRVYPSRGGVTVYFRDITARRQAEEALRESEGRHRALFAHSLEGIALTAPDGAIYDMNAAGCELLGRSRDEIVALGRAGVVDTSDPRLAVLLAERQRVGHVRGELTMVRGDGTHFPAEMSSAIFVDAGGHTRTSLTFRDLTAQKRALGALQLLAETSAAVQSSLELPEVLGALAAVVVPVLAEVVSIDVIGAERPIRVIAADRAHQAPEVDVLAAAPPTYRAGHGIAKVLESGEPELVPVVTEAWLRDAAPDDLHLSAARAVAPSSVLIVPLIARGAVVGAMTLVRCHGGDPYRPADLPLAGGIADRAALAIDNARLYQDAVAARQRRDEMVGIVSHDLRNPLSSINLNAHLLANREPSRAVESIQRAVARAERLVKDLVAITAIDAGRLPLERRPEPVAEILAEVVELHRPLADDKRLALTAAADEGVGRIDVDRHRIVQALSNLVGNAIKFTSAGRVELRARRDDRTVIVEVADTGVGIPADQLDHLFDRFWRGRTGEGIGLGLAIAKGVVDAHGGSVEVRSRPGEGTTFAIRLPSST